MRLEIHKNNLCPKDSVVKIPGVAGYTQPEIRNSQRFT
jgi:hypothetical protein